MSVATRGCIPSARPTKLVYMRGAAALIALSTT